MPVPAGQRKLRPGQVWGWRSAGSCGDKSLAENVQCYPEVGFWAMFAVEWSRSVAKNAAGKVSPLLVDHV